MEEHVRKKILEAVRAIEIHMQLSCIAMGIIQSLLFRRNRQVKMYELFFYSSLGLQTFYSQEYRKSPAFLQSFRKCYYKFSSRAGSAGNGDFSSMSADQLFDDGQAQTISPNGTRMVGLIHSFKNMWEIDR